MPKPSLRGLTFRFEPEEHVLCFEPDCTKARVLYEAKILESVPARDRKGRRKPEYLIHFQGWNSSWDRTVPEGFVLKNSDRNRLLMRRLASTTRHASNRMRRRRIHEILCKHFKNKLPKFDWSDSDSSSSSGSSSESEEEEDDTESASSSQEEDEEEEEEDDSDGMEDGQARHRANRHMNGHARRGQRSESDSDMSDDEVQFNQGNGHHEEEKEFDPVLLELDLPKNLRTKLEDDCYFIRCQDKLVSLPADPNVLSILEGYVKNFAANVLCATEEKSKPYSMRDKDRGIVPEKNIELCKQVMDGLRLIFDFGLPLILLYDEEKVQYESLSENKMEPAVQSPMSSAHPTPTQVPISPRSPRSPRFSPRHIKDESEEEEEEEEVAEAPSRRLTRQSLHGEVHKSHPESRSTLSVKQEAVPPRTRYHSESRKHKDSSGSTHEEEEKEEDHSRRRGSLRSRSRHGSGLGSTLPLPIDKEVRRVSNNSEKTEPLNPPDGGSINSSSAHTSNSQDTDGAISFRYREVALANIFSWKLVPDDEASRKPAQPSAIYGAQHLLRLFVKLPEIVGRMHLATCRFEALTKHLELFVQYLSTRCDELFLDSHYDSDTD